MFLAASADPRRVVKAISNCSNLAFPATPKLMMAAFAEATPATRPAVALVISPGQVVLGSGRRGQPGSGRRRLHVRVRRGRRVGVLTAPTRSPPGKPTSRPPPGTTKNREGRGQGRQT